MEIKGIHIDLKAQMMRYEYLLKVITDISELGFNTILLEYQDKFPYSGELAQLAAPDALTIEQVEEIKILCSSKNIEIIPMVQSIGHMYWVTRFEAYMELGEHFHEKGRGSHSLCTSNPESFRLFQKIAEQVMVLHTDSKYFHIGGDEVKISDNCEKCSLKARGELLGRYYDQALHFVMKHNYIPVMWGDMILKNEEIIEYIPKETILMDWEYHKGLSEENYSRFYKDQISFSKADNTSFENTKKLMKKGFEVLCAPALRSMGDSAFIPRNIHLDNCVQAMYTALDNQTKGIMVTSWAVRRSPWQLTSNVLYVMAELFANPDITYYEAMQRVSEKIYGTKNIKLAEGSFVLAKAVENAMNAADFLSSGQDFMDAETGMFLSDSMKNRLKNIDIRNNETVKDAYCDLYKTANRLMSSLCDQENNEEIRMLLWAAQCAEFYGSYVMNLCDKYNDICWLTGMLSKFDEFKEHVFVLQDYYTDFTMPSELQSRVQIHKDFIEELIVECECLKN